MKPHVRLLVLVGLRSLMMIFQFDREVTLICSYWRTFKICSRQTELHKTHKNGFIIICVVTMTINMDKWINKIINYEFLVKLMIKFCCSFEIQSL